LYVSYFKRVKESSPVFTYRARNPEGKSPFGSSRCRWKGINIYLKEIGYEGVE
jgi:hypothetical protein